jgi:hypothetical protein
MLPAFTTIITKVNEFVNYFGTLSQSSREYIVIAGLIAAAIGPIIFIMGTLITSFGVVAGAIAAVSIPVLATIGILAGLTAGITYLWTTNEGFRKFILATWETIKTNLTISFNFIKTTAIQVWNSLLLYWQTNGGQIMQTIWLAWNYIYNNILVPMWNGIKTLATTIFDGLSLFWSVWGENIKIYFSVTWDTIKSVFSATLDIIGGLLKVFAGIFAGDWAMIWNGAKDIFVGIWNAITASLKGFINIMINGLNGLIAGMNRISFSVPAWVPMLGGKSFSFNIPQIPMLANGGIIDSPTLAMIGESGGEAVVPLENSSFIDGFASKVASAMVGAMRFSGSGQGSSGGDVILQIDGTQLARVLSPYQDRESQRKGNKLIIQGV